MKFSKSLDWLKESDEDNLLADDELDAVEEEMNEGLYVDPSNYDKHNDLVDVVDKAGNSQKMTQATYDKNKDSGEFEKKEPEEKEVKAGKKPEKLVPGNIYSIHKPIMISDDISMFDEKEQEIIKKNGWLNKRGEVILPKGTDVIYQERGKYDDVFQTKDGELSFDTAISDDFSDFREKEELIKDKVKVGKKVDSRALKEGNSYVTKEDMYYGDAEEFDGIYDIDELKKKGFVKDNEIVIPAGTKLNYEGSYGGAYTFDINGEEFDLSLDDVDLYETEEQKPISKGFNKDFADNIKKKYGEDDYKAMVALAAQNDAELYPENTAKLIKQDTNISDEDIDKFIQMYTYDDHDSWKA